MNVGELSNVVDGQGERNVMDVSKKNYLGSMNVVTGILNKIDGLDTNLVFELNPTGAVQYHPSRCCQ